MMVHVFYSSSQEVEACRYMWVCGHPDLQSELQFSQDTFTYILFQNTTDNCSCSGWWCGPLIPKLGRKTEAELWVRELTTEQIEINKPWSNIPSWNRQPWYHLNNPNPTQHSGEIGPFSLAPVIFAHSWISWPVDCRQVYSTTMDQKTMRQLTLLCWSCSSPKEVGVPQTPTLRPSDTYHETHLFIGPALKNWK